MSITERGNKAKRKTPRYPNVCRIAREFKRSAPHIFFVLSGQRQSPLAPAIHARFEELKQQ